MRAPADGVPLVGKSPLLRPVVKHTHFETFMQDARDFACEGLSPARHVLGTLWGDNNGDAQRDIKHIYIRIMRNAQLFTQICLLWKEFESLHTFIAVDSVV